MNWWRSKISYMVLKDNTYVLVQSLLIDSINVLVETSKISYMTHKDSASAQFLLIYSINVVFHAYISCPSIFPNVHVDEVYDRYPLSCENYICLCSINKHFLLRMLNMKGQSI